MDLEKIKEQLKNEPSFRYKQAFQAIFVNLCVNWDEVSGFPKALREKLNKKLPLDLLVLNSENQTGSEKVAINFQGDVVEAVLMKHSRRNTVCVSSQVGCALKCDFCATGELGYKRNLTAMEIVAQVLYFARILKKKNQKVSNVVFMGMGEPLKNYDEVMAAVRILNDKDGLNIGARKISISTVGIISGIKKLSKENLQVNLAVSLHAANNDLRNEIMPINKNFPLKNLLSSIKEYMKLTNRKVMIEYVMLNEVNDSEKQAKELVDVLKTFLPQLFSVNLIAYNETGKYKPSTAARSRKFKHVLERSGISVIERYRFGGDIKAACGQLAGVYKK